MNITRRVLKIKKVNKSSLARNIEVRKTAKDFISNNVPEWVISDNPLEYITEAFMSSVELMIKMANESNLDNETIYIEPQTSYVVMADGEVYKTEPFNHDGFMLRWFLQNKPQDFTRLMITGHMIDLNDEFYKACGAITFTYGGNFGVALSGDNYKTTKKQKEKLLQIYEVNGIADRYFTEIECT